MAAPGKLIEKLFKDNEIRILISNFEGETLELAQFSLSNKYILCGIVVKYYDEFGILEIKNHANQSIYINEENIDCFFDPTVNISKSINVMIPSGKKLKRDIM